MNASAREESRRAITVARALLAAYFIGSGANMLLGLVHLQSPDAGERMIGFVRAVQATGYLWVFIGSFKVAAGILLAWPRSAALGAVIAMPWSVNIALLAMFLEPGRGPATAAALVLGLNVLLLWSYRARYLPLLDRATGERDR
jgi:uncharacterized membrane protein YphA (DoxX/SURF4 family)